MNRLNWHVIFNPVAGNKSSEKSKDLFFDLLVNKLSLKVEKIWSTQHQGHAIELAKNAIEEGAKNIISIGGDGTNHEVINGILLQKIIPSNEITYAHLPLGSGNDWVKTTNIPSDIKAWGDMMKKQNTIFHNVGKIIFKKNNQLQFRYFINVAGLAYDAFVVKFIENQKSRKKSGSIYLLMILKCLFKYKKRSATVRFNGKAYTDTFYTINIGICKYSGGGMSLVPHANPHSDHFAVTLAGNISKWSVLINTWRFYNESILKHKKINGFFAKEITIESATQEPVEIEADGEYLGTGPVTITLLPKVLKIVIP